MKNFMEKITSDEAFKNEFIEYMHKNESKVKDASERIGKELNKFMMESFKDFAEEKGMSIEFDQETADKYSALCCDSATHLNDMIEKTFSSYN